MAEAIATRCFERRRNSCPCCCRPTHRCMCVFFDCVMGKEGMLYSWIGEDVHSDPGLWRKHGEVVQIMRGTSTPYQHACLARLHIAGR